MDILERLRGYNLPDRTIEQDKQLSTDIFDAAAEIEKLRKLLALIASHKGKTLLGDGRYDEGANAAFEQMAAIAQDALSPSNVDAKRLAARSDDER